MADLGRLVQEVHKARGDFEARVDEVEAARETYYRAVSRLNEAGMPMREIAEELGLSHQRVHQMIGDSDRKKRLRKVAAKAARITGATLLGLALFGGGWAMSRSLLPEQPRPVPSAVESDDRTTDECDGSGLQVRFGKADASAVKFMVRALENSGGLLCHTEGSFGPLIEVPTN